MTVVRGSSRQGDYGICITEVRCVRHCFSSQFLRLLRIYTHKTWSHAYSLHCLLTTPLPEIRVQCIPLLRSTRTLELQHRDLYV
jgi:hypothetical protein